VVWSRRRNESGARGKPRSTPFAQTSASAQEMSASAQELAATAQQLDSLVRRFKVAR
jgi:hypothetical protein